MTTADSIIESLRSMENEEQRIVLSRFFKTGEGGYGHGDRFLGLKVPMTRLVVKLSRLDVPLTEITKLLYSPWHEVRLCGLLLIVEEMKAATPKSREPLTAHADKRQKLADFYLKHARQANNWDLVDLSCEFILGPWLIYPGPDGTMPDANILDRLADSDSLWEQRISIVTTLALVRNKRYEEAMRIAAKLLGHPHDLIHKATGWILREVGKRDIELLRGFLDSHYTAMHRTTLRYAIENMDTSERLYWMKKGTIE